MDDQNDKIDSSTIAGRLRQATGSPQYAKRSIIVPPRDAETTPIAPETTQLPMQTVVQSEPVPITGTLPRQATVNPPDDLHSKFGIEREELSTSQNHQKVGFLKKLFGKNAKNRRRS